MKSFNEFLSAARNDASCVMSEDVAATQPTLKHTVLAVHSPDDYDYGRGGGARYTLHHPDGTKTHKHSAEEMRAHLKKYGTDIRRPKKTKSGYENHAYWGVPNAAHATEKASAISAKSKPVSHAGLTLNNGVITDSKGKHVGTATHHLQHGYHPVVKVSIPGKPDKHFELDHHDLPKAILSHAAS